MAAPSTSRIPDSEQDEATLQSGDRLVSSGSSDVIFARKKSGVWQVFHRDRANGATTQVTLDGNGNDGDDDTFPVSIGSGGEKIMMRTWASNLVGSISPRPQMIYRDITDAQGTFSLISQDGNGNEADSECFHGSMDSNGELFVFHSRASNLHANASGSNHQIFLFDRPNGTVNLVTQDGGGNEGDDGSFRPSISRNGQWVAFSTEASNLFGNLTGNPRQVVLKDRNQQSFRLASVDNGGAEANAPCTKPAVNEDGSFIAFISRADNLSSTISPDGTDEEQVFVFDRSASHVRLVSVDQSEDSAVDDCRYVDISPNGDVVGWTTTATNFSSISGHKAVYATDRTTSDPPKPVSLTENDDQPDGDSHRPSFSPDGSDVLFSSQAENLVSGDTNLMEDIFIREGWDALSTTPVADAGGDRPISLGERILLDGSGSKDLDQRSNSLTYEWSIVTKPAQSNPSLSSTSGRKVHFTADSEKGGKYEVELKVTDQVGQSSTDRAVLQGPTLATSSVDVSVSMTNTEVATRLISARSYSVVVLASENPTLYISASAQVRARAEENPTLTDDPSYPITASVIATASKVTIRRVNASVSTAASVSLTAEKIDGSVLPVDGSSDVSASTNAPDLRVLDGEAKEVSSLAKISALMNGTIHEVSAQMDASVSSSASAEIQ